MMMMMMMMMMMVIEKYSFSFLPKLYTKWWFNHSNLDPKASEDCRSQHRLDNNLVGCQLYGLCLWLETEVARTTPIQILSYRHLLHWWDFGCCGCCFHLHPFPVCRRVRTKCSNHTHCTYGTIAVEIALQHWYASNLSVLMRTSLNCNSQMATEHCWFLLVVMIMMTQTDIARKRLKTN